MMAHSTMAMPATHILFALEIASALGATDHPTYLSGSIYPDSRYATGIARDKTHGQGCPRILPGTSSSLTDFQKGWASHLYYDEEAGREQKALIPKEYVHESAFDEWWMYLTAMKVLEDRTACLRLQTLGAWDELAQIHTTEQPQGEETRKVNAYYEAVRRCYVAVPTNEAYKEFFCELGAPKTAAERILQHYELIREDPQKAEKILSLYPQMVQRFA